MATPGAEALPRPVRTSAFAAHGPMRAYLRWARARALLGACAVWVMALLRKDPLPVVPVLLAPWRLHRSAHAAVVLADD